MLLLLLLLLQLFRFHGSRVGVGGQGRGGGAEERGGGGGEERGHALKHGDGVQTREGLEHERLAADGVQLLLLLHDLHKQLHLLRLSRVHHHVRLLDERLVDVDLTGHHQLVDLGHARLVRHGPHVDLQVAALAVGRVADVALVRLLAGGGRAVAAGAVAGPVAAAAGGGGRDAGREVGGAAGQGGRERALAGRLVDGVQVRHGVVMHQQDVLLGERLLAHVTLVGAAGVVVALQGVAGRAAALAVQLRLVVGRQVALLGEAHLTPVAPELPRRILVVAHRHGLAVDEVLQRLLVREALLQLLFIFVFVQLLLRFRPPVLLLHLPGNVHRQRVHSFLLSSLRGLLHHAEWGSLGAGDDSDSRGRPVALRLGHLTAQKVGQEAFNARAAG